MKARDEVWVDAAPEEVFEFMVDPGGFPQWMSGVSEARFGVGSEPGLGATVVAECAECSSSTRAWEPKPPATGATSGAISQARTTRLRTA